MKGSYYYNLSTTSRCHWEAKGVGLRLTCCNMFWSRWLTKLSFTKCTSTHHICFCFEWFSMIWDGAETPYRSSISPDIGGSLCHHNRTSLRSEQCLKPRCGCFYSSPLWSTQVTKPSFLLFWTASADTVSYLGHCHIRASVFISQPTPLYSF